jgi:hypothetical protein
LVGTVFDAIADPDANAASVLGVTVDALRLIWTEEVNTELCLPATQALLRALDRRSEGRRIIRTIARNAQVVKAETPNFVLKLAWYLQNWMNTGDVSDFSWVAVGPRPTWVAGEA